MSSTAPISNPNPVKPKRLGIISLVFALVGLALAFVSPVALLAWLFTLPGFIIGLVVWVRKGRTKGTAIAGTVISTIAFLTSIVTFSVYAASLPTEQAASQSSISSSSSHRATEPKSTPHTPTPTPTPTPPPPVPDASLLTPAEEAAALTTDGYTVVVVDTSGKVLTNYAGYKFVRQSPAAGSPLELGSTVTLTLEAPPPPPVVHTAPKAPVAPSHPSGATAECRDHTFSYSQHRSGTCSHHHGVLIWF